MKKSISIFLSVLIFCACQKETVDNSITHTLKTDSTSLTLLETIGDKDSFNIQSDIDWAIAIEPSTADWLQVNVSTGNGNAKIYVTVTKNNTTDLARSATLAIKPVNSPGVQSVQIAVTQSKQGAKAKTAFGGSENDMFFQAVATPDGGFIAIGWTDSEDGDISGQHGEYEDAWIVKIDASGNKVWQKTLGGSGRDGANTITKTSDGNYLVQGWADVADGDLAGKSAGVWLLKIDDGGNILLNKVITGIGDGSVNSFVPANGGGYVMTGSITLAGTTDIWVVKVDDNFNKVWEKVYGGMWLDSGSFIEKATDGYIVIGSSQSTDRDIVGSHGGYDMIVLKLDESGNKSWLKCFGGTGDEAGHHVLKQGDGYLICGSTNSADGDVIGNHGNSDAWILKINATGVIQWQKTYGGTNGDGGGMMIPATGGGYIIAGGTASNNGDVTGFKGGGSDGWIFKIDNTGALLWQKTVGGAEEDGIYSIVELSSGNYFIAGSTFSNDGDVVGYRKEYDAWAMKVKQPE